MFDSPRQRANSGVYHRRHLIKRLSLRLPELAFPPYAEAHCTQQNAQISGETLQDHRRWQSLEDAFLATPSVVDQKRKTQTPAGQGSARRQDRCSENKGESSFRLIRRCLVTEVRQQRSLSRCPLRSNCRGCGGDAVPLPRRFQRIRRRLGAVKITPINERCAGCRRNRNRNQ